MAEFLLCLFVFLPVSYCEGIEWDFPFSLASMGFTAIWFPALARFTIEMMKCVDMYVKFESNIQRDDGFQPFPQSSLRHWMKPSAKITVLTVCIAY